MYCEAEIYVLKKKKKSDPMEIMQAFIWQRCHILPYSGGQGLETMHGTASLLFV